MLILAQHVEQMNKQGKPHATIHSLMELKASVLGRFTATKSITACGLKKAIKLTESKLKADNSTKPDEARETILCVFISDFF